MLRRIGLALALGLAFTASAAWAQDPRVEVGATAGWTFSDGVSGGTYTINGDDFTRLDPKDAFSWGARIGFFVTPNVEVGALFNQQSTQLELSGLSQVLHVADESVYNYHGYVAYNFGESDAKVRPYFLGGLGATHFGGVTLAGGIQLPTPQSGATTGGETKFSSTWALGAKLYPSPKVGIRLEGRWTPTYIKSDYAGTWCDPYWGCYALGDAQYANQFELSGGITLRF